MSRTMIVNIYYLKIDYIRQGTEARPLPELNMPLVNNIEDFRTFEQPSLYN